MAEVTEILPEVLTAIVQDVFTTMVRLSVAPASDAPAGQVAPASVTATVGITGAKSYIVVLQTTEKLACRFCAAMLGEEVGEWSDMVSDTFGEIANITAGNLKANISEGLKLTVPVVVRGSDYKWKSPTTKLLLKQQFVCEGDVLTIWVGEEQQGGQRS